MSEEFLQNFFNGLAQSDFENDQFLKRFYLEFMEEKATGRKINLFLFFKYYITQPRNHTDKVICKNLDEAAAEERIDEITKEIIDQAKTIDSEKVVIKKKRVMPIISEYIRRTFQIVIDDESNHSIKCEVISENLEELSTQYDENFRDITTKQIISDITEDGRRIPKSKNDEKFDRINNALSIWSDTEIKCNKFLELDSKLKKKTFLFNSLIINDKTDVITSEEIRTTENKESSVIVLESDVIKRRSKNISYQCSVYVTRKDPLTVTLEKSKEIKQTIYMCSGSIMVPGGGSDQGYETPETALYYATTYSIGVNLVGYAYPLKLGEHLFLPYVLVFKNHIDQKYPLLPSDGIKCISVVTVPPMYRPKTNLIEQKTYDFDSRLMDENTKYSVGEVEKQLRSALNLCHFLGFEVIIMDDQGIKNYWLPAIDHISKMYKVLSEYRSKFKEIIICVPDGELYAMYNKIFNC